jgi:hypothetical protein
MLTAVYDEFTVTLVAVVPEPGTAIMAAAGFGIVGLRRRAGRLA